MGTISCRCVTEMYGPQHAAIHTEDAIECAVCFSIIATKGTVTLACGHRFCYDCIEKWIATKHSEREAKTCPCCRAPVPDVHAYAISPALEVIDYEPLLFTELHRLKFESNTITLKIVRALRENLNMLLAPGRIESLFDGARPGDQTVRLSVGPVRTIVFSVAIFNADRTRELLKKVVDMIDFKMKVYEELMQVADATKAACRNVAMSFSMPN